MKGLSIAVTLVAALALATGSAGAQQPAAKKPTKDAAMHAAAKITEDAARKIALGVVPGATVKDGELEKENGKLIWSFDLKVAGKKGVEEVQVDAVTGKVVSHEHESDAKEKAEAKAEKVKPATKKP